MYFPCFHFVFTRCLLPFGHSRHPCWCTKKQAAEMPDTGLGMVESKASERSCPCHRPTESQDLLEELSSHHLPHPPLQIRPADLRSPVTSRRGPGTACFGRGGSNWKRRARGQASLPDGTFTRHPVPKAEAPAPGACPLRRRPPAFVSLRMGRTTFGEGSQVLGSCHPVQGEPWLRLEEGRWPG